MSWKLKLALWLLKLEGKQPIVVPAMSSELIASAKAATASVAPVLASGEYKRGQAIRVLLNKHPEESEGNCSRAIELVLCGAVS